MANTDCPFCNTPDFGRLIIQGNKWYSIATLGQIAPGYVLVVPKKHLSCLGAASTQDLLHLLKMQTKLFVAISEEYTETNPKIEAPAIMFEHGIVGQTVKHAHLHMLPVSVDLTPRIRADFPDCEFQLLRTLADLLREYQERQEPYLLWSTPDSDLWVCWNPPAPPQYLRTILAEILEVPERGNWREMDPELDKQLYTETTLRLRPYFNNEALLEILSH